MIRSKTMDMVLLEHDGKQLFTRYGIVVPSSVVVRDVQTQPFGVVSPCVVKAQVPAGGRGKAGGVRRCGTADEAQRAVRDLLGWEHAGARADAVLVEECIDAVVEYYASCSYDTDTRSPVLAVSSRGGVDVTDVTVAPFDPDVDVHDAVIADTLQRAAIPVAYHPAVGATLHTLAQCFLAEQALLVEINPLFITRDGRAIAGDAKVVLDDDVVRPTERRFLALGGDIAVLASGGGASLLNIDALMAHGGKPANYTEYSGNPPPEVVRDLTVRVLSQPGMRGCWVVGGTANFTDIAATMEGFIAGLRSVQPKPTYPIVVRRDGPRQREAFAMLRDVATREGYQLYTFGSETPMEESARIMVKLAYG